jgi:hypothetical protein
VTNLNVVPERTAYKPLPRTKSHFPKPRYWALMLVAGGGEYIYGHSPEGAARGIWRRNTPRCRNFDSGDIERNQRTADRIMSGDVEWQRHDDGSFWCNG